jgi:hypothetical protein
MSGHVHSPVRPHSNGHSDIQYPQYSPPGGDSYTPPGGAVYSPAGGAEFLPPDGAGYLPPDDASYSAPGGAGGTPCSSQDCAPDPEYTGNPNSPRPCYAGTGNCPPSTVNQDLEGRALTPNSPCHGSGCPTSPCLGRDCEQGQFGASVFWNKLKLEWQCANGPCLTGMGGTNPNIPLSRRPDTQSNRLESFDRHASGHAAPIYQGQGRRYASTSGHDPSTRPTFNDYVPSTHQSHHGHVPMESQPPRRHDTGPSHVGQIPLVRHPVNPRMKSMDRRHYSHVPFSQQSSNDNIPYTRQATDVHTSSRHQSRADHVPSIHPATDADQVSHARQAPDSHGPISHQSRFDHVHEDETTGRQKPSAHQVFDVHVPFVRQSPDPYTPNTRRPPGDHLPDIPHSTRVNHPSTSRGNTGPVVHDRSGSSYKVNTRVGNPSLSQDESTARHTSDSYQYLEHLEVTNRQSAAHIQNGLIGESQQRGALRAGATQTRTNRNFQDDNPDVHDALLRDDARPCRGDLCNQPDYYDRINAKPRAGMDYYDRMHAKPTPDGDDLNNGGKGRVGTTNGEDDAGRDISNGNNQDGDGVRNMDHVDGDLKLHNARHDRRKGGRSTHRSRGGRGPNRGKGGRGQDKGNNQDFTGNMDSRKKGGRIGPGEEGTRGRIGKETSKSGRDAKRRGFGKGRGRDGPDIKEDDASHSQSGAQDDLVQEGGRDDHDVGQARRQGDLGEIEESVGLVQKGEHGKRVSGGKGLEGDAGEEVSSSIGDTGSHDETTGNGLGEAEGEGVHSHLGLADGRIDFRTEGYVDHSYTDRERNHNDFSQGERLSTHDEQDAKGTRGEGIRSQEEYRSDPSRDMGRRGIDDRGIRGGLRENDGVEGLRGEGGDSLREEEDNIGEDSVHAALNCPPGYKRVVRSGLMFCKPGETTVSVAEQTASTPCPGMYDDTFLAI